jgi:LEA14-like dessication related protein
MKNPLLRLVSLAVCLSGLVGCTSHGTLGGIAVTVVAVKPAAPPAPETQAVLTLQFANENVASVAMDNSTHRLFLNGLYVGKATSQTPEGLPAMAPTTLKIPVTFENLAMVRQLANAAGAKTTSYRLESDMLVVFGDDKIHVKSNEQGTLDLSPLAGTK